MYQTNHITISAVIYQLCQIIDSLLNGSSQILIYGLII